MIFRPRAVMGPGDRTIAPRIAAMAQKKRFPLVGGGLAWTDITAVEHVVDAVRAALSAQDNAWNRAYNLSNGQPIRMRDWFAQLLEAMHLPFRPRRIPMALALALGVAWISEAATWLRLGPPNPAMTRFSVGYMARSMTLSIDSARSLLGFRPHIDNQACLSSYASWVRSHEPHP